MSELVDAGFLRDAAIRIRQRMSRTAEDIVEIGRDLIEVKGRLAHGEFLSWIDAEFRMSSDTTQRFMLVAKLQIPPVAEFQPSVLYALAAPSTPEEVRAAVTEKVASGEAVTVADVKALKKAASIGKSATVADSQVAKVGEIAAAKAELRAVVTDAATRGLRGRTGSSNKNPNYQPPSAASAAWMHVYGVARALVEWATPDNVALAIAGRNERGDDQYANMRAVWECLDTVSNLIGSLGARPGLAEMGKRVVHGVPEESFKQATHLIGTVNRFAEFCRANSAATVASSVLPSEQLDITADIAVISAWLDRFAVALDRAAPKWIAPHAAKLSSEMMDFSRSALLNRLGRSKPGDPPKPSHSWRPTPSLGTLGCDETPDTGRSSNDGHRPAGQVRRAGRRGRGNSLAGCPRR
ncbi:DUF3102 domain-containing protein [Bradyrhizobium murdochi]|uniref:DUF3102 domain-containing protein n=1 Tax=Bradyrhizobium murdochi TaxID=1038859 RepID=UPI00047FCDFC|nr:DUF3102 domain-containing protein [Bradyrhizobium murdochi]